MTQAERQPLLGISSTPVFPDEVPDPESAARPATNSPKTLTWTSAYILVISRVIGSGIFATPGSIVKSAGSVGLSLLIWGVGTVLAACGLAVSLEYGCMLPRSGGDKVYLEYTYPRPRFLASTLIAVQAVLLGFTASNCIVFAKYTFFAFNVEPTELQHKVLALGLITFVTIMHGFFLRTGIWVQNVLGWLKIFLVGAISLTGIWVILVRPPSETDASVGDERGSVFSSWDSLWEDSNWSWNLLSTSLFKVIYSYAGLSNLNNVMNEVRDPVRTLKTVCPAALLTAGALYFLANVSYFLVVPIEEIKNSGELVAALLFERLFGNQIGRTLLPLAIAISAAGNVMVVTFALARVNQEIARQGFLPWSKVLSSSRPFGAPLGGLIVHYIPSVLVIALPPQGDVYNFILDVEGYPGQFFSLAVTLGLLLLRYKEPDLPRPFQAWLPAVWLRVLISLVLLASPFFPPEGGKGDVGFFYATYAIVGTGVIVFGVLYWYVWTVLLPRWADSFERPSESVPTTIHDVSGHEAEYTLDGNGFQFHPHVSAEKDFLDDEQIKRVYYPEVDRLLKEVTGATRTYIFDHTIRRPAANAQAQLRTPVHRVHIDQSFPAAVSRVSHHLPDDAEELLKGRHQIINVWRPLKTVRRDPLAVAEAHTVDDADLVPIKLIYPDREGETYAVRANPATKWYYRHAQTPEWVTLIKCYDSKTDGRARRVPHSAFVIPGTENEEARESIEVRVLVFTPEDRE
ncbi:putative methionine permease [Aspergillus fijiensis CBS 313.89]|uniref:Methionine permease n=1 Tax=Aspergillus fijiensis CBS 313.89 TaxID=1448319 RepID=A0A8G1W277_9EURO|nr:uncharacterized protein BO72DRAFT_475521 [Aspergillus fijiensis CBS 313.89]RAK80176.1 hypothetical protein BO72DRAFT_475521 [Aspergillus fijiensis CBS 313.89]